MATVDRYKVQMDVEGERQVKSLDLSIESLNNKVAGLSTALFKASAVGAGALTALAASAVRTAKTMTDLQGISGFTAGEIYQLSVAAEQAGGTFEQMPAMLIRFSETISRAAEGADEMRRALEQVGIGQEEIQKLDDQQLFRRVIQGFADLEDGLQKTSLAQRLFGEEAARMDLTRFSQLTRNAVDPELQARLENAGELVRQLDRSFRDLQMAALEALGPIIEQILSFEITVDEARKGIIALASVTVALFSAATILAIIRAATAISILTKAIVAAATAKTVLISLTGAGLALVAAAGAAGTATYLTLTNRLKDATDAQEAFNDEAGRTPSGQTPGMPDEPGGNRRDWLLSAEEQRIEGIRRTNRELVERNRITNEHRRAVIQLQGLNAEQNALMTSNLDAERDLQLELLNVQSLMNEEAKKGSQASMEAFELLRQRRETLIEQLGVQQQINEEQFNQAQHLKNLAVQEQIVLEMARNRAIEEKNVQEIMLMQQRIAGQISDTEMRTIQQLAALETDHREKMFALREQEQQASRASDAAEVRRIKHLMEMEEQRFQMSRQQIAVLRQLQEELDQSAIAGTADALEQLSRQFTPYQMAQDAILQGWNTIDGAITDLANNGKLKFGEMARSILRDLAAMIIRAQVFQAIMTAFNAMGIASFITGALGGGTTPLPNMGGTFALGGMIPAGKVGLVGERGPEFISGPAQITPIKQSDMRAQPTQVNYYIEAIDTRSFQDRLAQDPEFLFGVTQRGARGFAI